jgi:hypothetical protein
MYNKLGSYAFQFLYAMTGYILFLFGTVIAYLFWFLRFTTIDEAGFSSTMLFVASVTLQCFGAAVSICGTGATYLLYRKLRDAQLFSKQY